MNKTVTVILIFLVIIVGVTAYLNRLGIADKEVLQEKAILIIKENGSEVIRVDFDFIQKQGEVTFNKELDTSDTGPVEQTYTGVPLQNVLLNSGISLDGKSQVIVRAIDGYTVALTAREVLEPDNVYLVYKNKGKFLRSKNEGGTGPYRIVIKKDLFGQRWCKFVTEVEVQ